MIPSKPDQFRSETMKKQLEEKLLSMNKSLKAPQDAEVKLEGGKIVISDSIHGEQYDISALLEDLSNRNIRVISI